MENSNMQGTSKKQQQQQHPVTKHLLLRCYHVLLLETRCFRARARIKCQQYNEPWNVHEIYVTQNMWMYTPLCSVNWLRNEHWDLDSNMKIFNHILVSSGFVSPYSFINKFTVSPWWWLFCFIFLFGYFQSIYIVDSPVCIVCAATFYLSLFLSGSACVRMFHTDSIW